MGIEFIARAVPLPGSIREVPINVKELRPVRASAVPRERLLEVNLEN